MRGFFLYFFHPTIMQPESFSTSTLAVFGAKGKFWTNVGPTLEPLFQKVIHVDPKIPNGPTPLQPLPQSYTLFFSVPDEQLAVIISQIRSALHGKIVLENLTTKDMDVLAGIQASGADICSLHTMVKTSSPQAGQLMIVLPFKKGSNAHRLGLDWARTLGMHTEELPPPQHHAAVSEPQAIDHILARVKARAQILHAAQHELSLDQLNRLSSASQKLGNLGRDRILHLDPLVSIDILQHAPETIALLKQAIEEIDAAMRLSRDTVQRLFSADAATLGITDRRADIQKQTDAIMATL